MTHQGAQLQADKLRPLVGSLRQFASVRRMTLQDGPEAGLDIISLSTGGGLDVWLLAGRSLDVGAVWFQGLPLAWQAPGGFVNSTLAWPDEDSGRGMDRLLGGFLTTCGLDRVRQPNSQGPLHGRLGLAPARVLVAREDWQASTPQLEVVAEICQYRLGAESLRLTRRITAPIGGASLRIEDSVINEGSQPQSHDILYHFNFGYPAIASGTTVQAGGRTLLGPIGLPNALCSREAECFPVAPQTPACELRTPLLGGGELRVAVEVDSASLPWLQLWHDLRPGCGLLAIEPCRSKRMADGQSEATAPLAQNESRQYLINIHFSRT